MLLARNQRKKKGPYAEDTILEWLKGGIFEGFWSSGGQLASRGNGEEKKRLRGGNRLKRVATGRRLGEENEWEVSRNLLVAAQEGRRLPPEKITSRGSERGFSSGEKPFLNSSKVVESACIKMEDGSTKRRGAIIFLLEKKGKDGAGGGSVEKAISVNGRREER